MIITLLCEPRSGSTNLANWFSENKDFTVLHEPITNPNREWYKNGISPLKWTYTTKHLLVKEILGDWNNPKELLSISDRIIALYRENEKEQIQSWLNAKATNDWHVHWTYKKVENRDEESLFRDYKRIFKEMYLTGKYFSISYEELYYRNGFQRVVDYLNIEEVKNVNFPYGYRYRKELH